MIFLLLFNIYTLPMWVIQVVYSMIKYFPLISGIILFYSGGEIWRRKFQRTGKYRGLIAILMLVGVSFIFYGIYISISPSLIFSEYSLKLGLTSLVSAVGGFIIAYMHVKKRHRLIII